MKKLALHWKIIIGLILGIGFAIFSSWMGISKFTLDWIAPFGTIFINLLKLIAVPLVLFSIITGIISLKDIRKIGRIGIKTLGFYLVTTVISVSIGLTLVNLIKPGTYIAEHQRKENRINYEMWAAANGVEIKDGKKIWDGSGVYKETVDTEIQEKIESAHKNKEAGPLKFLVDMVPSNIFVSLNDNSLMLQVIVFAIFFGLMMSSLPPGKTTGIASFIQGGNEIFLKMVDVVMRGAPFFVFALVAGQVAKEAGDDPGKAVEMFKGLAAYVLITIAGLGFMIFLFYPLLVTTLVKKMKLKTFMKGITPAQLLAFSSSSSAATLPVTMECVNENLKVDRQISDFVLPIGATVNMDGTSMYQAIAVVFLAQYHWIDLDLMQQLTIVLTATLASIGSAAVPSAGLIMLILVLESVGLNPAWIGIILPVDRLLDMCRTVVNVTGDATVSTIVASSEGQLGEQTD